jgi:hypothetical protein
MADKMRPALRKEGVAALGAFWQIDPEDEKNEPEEQICPLNYAGLKR